MHPLRTHIEEIVSLTDTEFDYVLSYFKHKRVRKHQYLVQEGESVPYDFWIIRGCVRSFFLDTEGREHILQFATENWWTTDYNGYFNQAKASIYTVCMEEGEVLALAMADREKLCEEMHKIAYFFSKKKQAAIVAMQRRILSLLSNNPQQRYEEFSSLYPKLIQRIPKKYIAAYLGVSRETLSRMYIHV
ncbi:MAG: Crp/Fnr family transcriptional regulator [Bacteroidia bacterium]|nr:Crp/Fnr family transcriptional regulator [Bacteroidia bacterium]